MPSRRIRKERQGRSPATALQRNKGLASQQRYNASDKGWDRRAAYHRRLDHVFARFDRIIDRLCKRRKASEIAYSDVFGTGKSKLPESLAYNIWHQLQRHWGVRRAGRIDAVRRFKDSRLMEELEQRIRTGRNPSGTITTAQEAA